MIKIVFLVLFSFIYLFSNENNSTDNTNLQTPIDYTKYFDADEEEINADKNYYEEIKLDENYSLHTKSIYLSKEYYPKKIFSNQRFYIEIKARVVTDNFDEIDTRFTRLENIKLLNPDSKWLYQENNIYKNRFYFKVENSNFTLPILHVYLLNDEKVIDASQIDLKSIKYNYIDINNKDENLVNIVADSIILKSKKMKQYNNKEILTIIELEGKNSNLEELFLGDVSLEQGSLSFEDNYDTQTLFYYFITPIYKKNVELKYYNNIDNRFEKIDIPIKIQEDLISTQTDLNPYDSNYIFYKKIALGTLTGLLLLLFVYKRNFITLIPFAIALIFFILMIMPNKKVILNKGATISIIPTKNSTVFYTTDNKKIVEILDSKDEYYKILFFNDVSKKDNIGWIKEEQIAKN